MIPTRTAAPSRTCSCCRYDCINKYHPQKIDYILQFTELFVNSIPKGYGRVDIIADCYKTRSVKSSEQFLRSQSEKIHIALLLSKVPINFRNRIP